MKRRLFKFGSVTFETETIADPYVPAEYPKPGFRCDAELQRFVTMRRKATDQRVKWLFLAWISIFAASILFGVFGLPIIFVIGLGVLIALFVPLAFSLVYAPAPNCPQCGKRMKKDWIILPNERSGEFLVCRNCQTYVYAHRTLR